MTKYWKIILLSLLAGFLGMSLFYLGFHIYQDHQNLHALINMVVQQQKQTPAK